MSIVGSEEWAAEADTYVVIRKVLLVEEPFVLPGLG